MLYIILTLILNVNNVSGFNSGSSNPRSVNNTHINNIYLDIKDYPDLYFECHIAEINRNTQIELFYNEKVRDYINLYFTERIDQVFQILERSANFFPIFIKYLDEFDLPPELKFLPILESALSEIAVSPSGAVGLWQFKKETGIHCGLKIDHKIDERTDPSASTIAACKYLKEMNEQFGDWHLALLAYQAGPGTIRRAIENSGGKKTYKELISYLPEQTIRYLPAFISMIYVFTFYGNHL